METKAEHPKIKELKYTLYRIFRNPSAIIGVVLLFAFITIALFAPTLPRPNLNTDPI